MPASAKPTPAGAGRVPTPAPTGPRALTPARSAAALGSLVALLALLWTPGARADLFSPGPLARSHADLEGLQNCTQCHISGQRLSQDKCLDCHTELKPRVKAGKGYHGRIPNEKRDCEKCHRDHEGRDFQMIEWVPSKKLFPHQDTGWPLKGKHEKLKCEQCHEPRFIQEPDIREWLKAHPTVKDTYLGVPTACQTCHFDEHRGQLSTQCQSCHVEKGWKPAPLFNHDKTDYPLTGKHKAVPCIKCHAMEADTTTPPNTFPAPVSKKFAVYKDIAHASCLDCHADPHDGKFGNACESCHTTEDWKIVRNAGGQDLGFHEKTRYPLRGMHVSVPCKSCHGPFPGKPAKFKNMAFKACTDCHVDAHEGQIETNGRPRACERCHTVDGFMPPHFELLDHQKTRYPLEGAHQAVPCGLCHAPEPALSRRIPEVVEQLLRSEKRKLLFSYALFDHPGRLDRCETCHQDVHVGQFTTARGPEACTTCHKLSSFHDLKFDHDRDSRFHLEGKHATTPCAGCHTKTRINGIETVRYKPLDTVCASCHVDVHGGQFDVNGEPKDCASCHDTRAFKPATFVHKPPFTTFLLEGKHQDVKCVGCHPDVRVEGKHVVRRYKGVPTTCAGCHKDFHHGEFKGFVP